VTQNKRALVNILFDLDGTLTDPREGILACFKYALQELQVALPTESELERFIGPPLWDSFSTLVGSANEAKLGQAVALYRERFAARGMFENKLYPGIADALAMLQKGGIWLYVATSKPRVFAERIVEYFGLEQYFRAIHGSRLDGSYADKSELIAEVLRSESLTPDETVMIGDRDHDVIGAKANGLFSVGALWGFGSRDELVSAGAELLCEAPNMLVETVRVFDKAESCG
jgi:phosphoglycolate phosphatase